MVIIPKISVVVPVYNVEEYLEQCIRSIINQRLTDIEIICVDDGSTDNSGSILDSFKKIDKRIVVVHQENMGYGKAVNVGIDLAKGEYIGIVESDDVIMTDMYEVLYQIAAKHDLDFIKAECYFCWDDFGYRIAHYTPSRKDYYGVVLKSQDRNLFFDFFMNTWSGIYKRNFLNKYAIRHHESKGASFQDNGFWMQTLYFANRAMWIDEPLYLYRQDNEKASVRSDGKEYAMLAEYQWVEERLKEKGVQETELSFCRYYRLFRHAGNFLRISDEKKHSFLNTIEREYLKYGDAFNGLAKESEKDWFKRFLADPQSFCENVIAVKEKTIKKLNSSSRIYIYGARDRAQRVFRILCLNGFAEKVDAFVVSSHKLDNLYCCQLPVRSIYDPHNDFHDSVVIIGTGKNTKSHREMEETLRLIGVLDYLEGDDFLENFYSVY